MNEARREPRSSLPAPIATGIDSYYLDRAADFCRRNPTTPPPTYYEHYGNKCLRQFRAAKPDLSTAGQAWMETTLRLLQNRMEIHRRSDPAAFARLELDDTEFQNFAFSTHADAYIEAGVFTLPADDLWRILRTPDTADLLSPDGMAEIFELLSKLDRDDIAHITSSTESIDGARPGFRSIVAGLCIRLARRLRFRKPSAPTP